MTILVLKVLAEKCVSPVPGGVSVAGEGATVVPSGLDSEKSSTAQKSPADALGVSEKGKKENEYLIN